MEQKAGLPGALRVVSWVVVVVMALALVYAAGISWMHWADISV